MINSKQVVIYYSKLPQIEERNRTFLNEDMIWAIPALLNSRVYVESDERIEISNNGAEVTSTLALNSEERSSIMSEYYENNILLNFDREVPRLLYLVFEEPSTYHNYLEKAPFFKVEQTIHLPDFTVRVLTCDDVFEHLVKYITDVRKQNITLV